ncbi:MAG: AAA-like domain-containing protein [Heteroscytonema crispum UTEX LB 1556]
MNSESELEWIIAKDFADQAVFSNTGKHLSDIEMMVFQGAWEGKTYDDIARIYGYSAEYLNKDVGNKLWRKLSELLGETVTKRNFKEALRRAWDKQRGTLTNIANVPFPEGSVAANSPFYVERFGVEPLCSETVVKPGSLIRIKAPELMGKTSLINRILNDAVQQNYQTVYLDLKSVDRGILTNLDKFLRWLCCMVGRQLKLKNRLNDYWDTEILGSNDNCTVYFEEYLLTEINCPIVLALDAVDRIFSYTEVVEDFFGLLRSWHEKGKIYVIWKQLRLVIAHSTEIYIPLDINQSPFNAGIPVELREFDAKQIKDLAYLYSLNWRDTQVNELMKMVGGHPYLVRLAMYYVSSGKIILEQLLQKAPTEAGIYSNHLRRYLEILQHVPDLALALKEVVTSPQPVELDSMHIYKLHSMGLVQRQDNHVIPRCNLYREYFQRVLI